MKSFLNALLILIAIIASGNFACYLYTKNEIFHLIGMLLFVLWVILLCIEENIKN